MNHKTDDKVFSNLYMIYRANFLRVGLELIQNVLEGIRRTRRELSPGTVPVRTVQHYGIECILFLSCWIIPTTTKFQKQFKNQFFFCRRNFS
jgi:hypothetical protein